MSSALQLFEIYNINYYKVALQLSLRAGQSFDKQHKPHSKKIWCSNIYMRWLDHVIKEITIDGSVSQKEITEW